MPRVIMNLAHVWHCVLFRVADSVDELAERPARAKTPAEATETLTEVGKSVRKPTKKHVRAVGAPLTIWARQKNRVPVTIRGPSDSQSQHQWSFWTSGALPTVRGPLNIRSSNGPFQAWGPLKFRHFIFISLFVNFGPSRKIVGQIRDFLILGRGYLGPWKLPPPPPPPPSYVPDDW